MDQLDLVAAWGANHIHKADDAREQAAVAMAIVALQPFVSQPQRIQWMGNAARWCPALGPGLAHIAWRLPETDIREAFLAAWPKIKAAKALKVGKTTTSIVSDISIQAPPVLTAIAHGNLQAVMDTVKWEGEPGLIELPGGMVQNKTLVGAPSGPAPWLAWALWFQQWDLADDLLALPSQRTQESLDRSLFDLVQRFASARPNHNHTYTKGRGDSRKINGLESDSASAWVEKLVKAGANPHYRPRAKVEHDRSEWFVGRMEGLDRDRFAADGWEVKQGNHYCSHPDTAMRDLKVGQAVELPSAAVMALQYDGPIGWRRLQCSMASLDESGRMAFDTTGKVFEEDFSKLAGMWTGATGEQWAQGIRAMVFAHANLLFEKSETRVHAWCPEFMLEGFAKADTALLARPAEDTPHCPWLDCIGVLLRAQERRLDEVADFHARGVEIMAKRLHGDADAFVRGLQRACVIKTIEGKSRFSFSQFHASVDEFLAIPGISGLLQSMDKDFIESFEAFASMDRDIHARWKHLANPDKDAIDSEESEAIEQASQTLQLHRSVLPSLARGVAPARPLPRM